MAKKVNFIELDGLDITKILNQGLLASDIFKFLIEAMQLISLT